MIHRIILLLLFFLIIPFSTPGQNFEHLTDKDGLVNNHVTAIIKDSYGFMWFGSYNGLSRYDGYNFYNYINNPSDSTSLSSNHIRCMYESKDKILFIGFQYTGFCAYNREKENFIRYRHDPKNPNSLMHDYVLTFYEDKKGNFWIGTRAGMDKFDVKTNSFTHYHPFSKNAKPFVTSITEDEEGNLWIYGVGRELCKFNPDNSSYEYLKFSDNENLSYVFNIGGVVKYDRSGNLWIGNELDGVYKYDIKTGTSENFSVENKKIRSNIIQCIVEDHQGNIYIGSDGGGMYKYDAKTKNFQTFINNPLNPLSIAGNAVYTIYESEPGLLWMGTYSSGVNILKEHKRKFFGCGSVGDENKRLSQKSVLSIIESKDGKVLLGTDGGGINEFDPSTRTLKYYTTENSIICTDIVKSMVLDKEGNLWLGSYGKGLCKVNFKNNKAINYRADMNRPGKTILRDNVWSLLETSDDKIWIGLLNGGVNIYDKKTDFFYHYNFDSLAFNNLGSANIFSLMEDSRKRVWITTENIGASCYDPATKVYMRFETDKNKTHGLPSNDIRDVFEDSKGNIWFGTNYGGLCLLMDFDKKEFKAYGPVQGLNTTNISSILEDDHEVLWLSTDKGISSFDPSKEIFKNFDIEDGLQSKEFTYASKLKSSNGYLYFGGADGFNVFHPDSIKYNEIPPTVLITDFKIFNESIKPGKLFKDRVVLEKASYLTKDITLLYEDYVFSLEFAALNFIAPEKHQYAYKLEGFDEHWIYVNSKKRFATYTNLDPGTYTFRVIASNNDGIWNNEGSSLVITILPPWWMTWWFRVAVFLVLISSFIGFYYYRLRSVQVQNMLLEEEVKIRTSQLKKQQEIKDKLYSIMGHDLKNPVGALYMLAVMLRKECKDVTDPVKKDLLEHMELSAGKMKDLVLSLLDWTKAQTSNIKLSIEKVNVYDLVKENIELHKSQAVLKDIDISCEMPEGYFVNGDRYLVNTAIRNILSNCIKFTPKSGSIFIDARFKAGVVTIMIRDTGVGMSEEMVKELFKFNKAFSTSGTENEKGTGLGLMICKEFIELNKGSIEVKSKLGEGSTFYIHLPGFCEKVVCKVH